MNEHQDMIGLGKKDGIPAPETPNKDLIKSDPGPHTHSECETDQPLITIVIPTRNRPHLARRAAKSALDQQNGSTEIIILENSDENELVYDYELQAECIKTYAAPIPLNMSANWERGLELAKGVYVTYISDKDTILPGAIKRFESLLRKSRPDCLAYPKPAFFTNSRRLALYRPKTELVMRDSAVFAEQWFRRPRHIHTAPMIYTAFFKREIILSRLSKGAFFNGLSPDVYSGLYLVGCAKHFLQTGFALCVSEMGEWSNGLAFGNRAGPKGATVEEFKRLYGSIWTKFFLPDNFSSVILKDFLQVFEQEEKLRNLRIDWQWFLRQTEMEILNFDAPESVKEFEFRKLASPFSPIPRREYEKWRFEYILWAKLAHYKAISATLFRMRRMFTRYLTTALDYNQNRMAIGEPFELLEVPAHSLEEAIEAVLEYQTHFETATKFGRADMIKDFGPIKESSL
jgi:glycosyltransferase involved in cell wall biosynthesis